jgi:virulence-associated protein VagC
MLQDRFRLTCMEKVSTRIYMKTTKLFRSGGSYAVRIPKAWVPKSREVILRREGRRIVISEAGSDLRDLARDFAKDGLIEFNRPAQPKTPPSKSM